MPTGNIPEAPELGTSCYKGKKFGSQWYLLCCLRGSTVDGMMSLTFTFLTSPHIQEHINHIFGYI